MPAPDYARTAFSSLQWLSRVVLVLMAAAMVYASWLSLINWSFIAV
jgi:hypothetical protein